jgi:hypothetical protein
LKAITVLQPWASLLIHGDKTIETRSWRTWHRGPLLIHAGQRPFSARRLALQEPFRAALRAQGFEWPDELPFGCVLGFAELTACVPTESLVERLDERERVLGDFGPGRWAWRLERPMRFVQPFPLRGVLGLFEVSDELLGQHPTYS